MLADCSFTQVQIVIFIHITFFIQMQETCLMSYLRCNIFTLKQIKPPSITRCRVGLLCVCVFTLLPLSHYFVYLSYSGYYSRPCTNITIGTRQQGRLTCCGGQEMKICLSFYIIQSRAKEQEFWAGHWVSVHRR